MRPLVTIVAAALLIAACGGGGTQPTPAAAAATTAAPAAAASAKFTADLKSENEVPPVPNEEKSGSGKATITLDLTRDGSGKIAAAKASFDWQLAGFPTTTVIILAHIHKAPAGQNGNPLVSTGLVPDSAIALSTGAATITKAGVTVDPDVAQQIVDKPSDFYFNVHSKLNPAGVVRGQLVKG